LPDRGKNMSHLHANCLVVLRPELDLIMYYDASCNHIDVSESLFDIVDPNVIYMYVVVVFHWGLVNSIMELSPD